MTASPDAVEVLARLQARGWAVGVAESLTGGLVVASLIDVPGASAWVRGGVVAYATELKHRILGVDAVLLAEHGPVHPDVARQMAEGVRAATTTADGPADVGIATTGIAGPTSPDGQPVGTVHVGVATPEGTQVVSAVLSGNRDDIRHDAVRLALRAAIGAL